MRTKTRRRRCRRPSRSFLDCLREFLTPALWKQAQQQRQGQAAFLALGHPALGAGVALDDVVLRRFPARTFRDGQGLLRCLPTQATTTWPTVQGFQKALAKMPTRVLRMLAAGVRQTLALRLAERWFNDGFIPLGCDGSRVECPRTAELEQHLGEAGKKGSAPSLWVTALVHLRLGLPWAWRLGKGTANERSHLLQMLALLPAAAILVADAGYFGFDLSRRLVAARTASCCGCLRTSRCIRSRPSAWRVIGRAWSTTGPQGAKQGNPLLLRLIRIRAKKKKHDVWLLTNVLQKSGCRR